MQVGYETYVDLDCSVDVESVYFKYSSFTYQYHLI